MKIACAAFALLLAAFPALAQNVKVTPIGSHPGELCANDRAIIFEDPTGVRFLYDSGPTVTGGNDPRLGTIHLVLLTHMHGDHVGDLKLKAPGEGTCANSARVPAPNSTTAEVVAAKNAVLVTTRAMAGFVHNKVDAIHGSGGKPPAAFIDWCLAWWLASTNRWLTMNGNPPIRPNLSSAVGAEDEDKQAYVRPPFAISRGGGFAYLRLLGGRCPIEHAGPASPIRRLQRVT